MEVHQLRYFVAVADLGGFTKAAERCFVAQPSLSQQIIKLETALGQRLSTAMSGGPGVQTISDIETELAGAQASMNSSKSTHQQTSATLTNMLQGITGVSNEQVGAELLSLQNQMAATMQTTAMLYQTSLVNYLK